MVFFFRRAAPVRVPGKVVLFGSATSVGQPLSLLLKLCPHVRELRCCASTSASRGVAVDLSHIDTDTTVVASVGAAEWDVALRGTSLVLLCCDGTSLPQCVSFSSSSSSFSSSSSSSPSLSQIDNGPSPLASVVSEVAEVMDAVASFAPSAIVGILTGPVNALVPVAREVLTRRGRFDPRRLFGVTTIDLFRTRVLVAHALQMNPFDVNVPVVGGRGGRTACPLIAQTGLRIPHDRIVSMTKEVQSYSPCHVPLHCGEGEENGQEHLAMASAAHEWSVSMLKALRGDRGIMECGLVESTMRREVPFFSSRVELGTEGVARLLPLGPLTAYEEELIDTAVPLLAKDVEAGLEAIGVKKHEVLSE